MKILNKNFGLLDIASVSSQRTSTFNGERNYVATGDIEINKIIDSHKVTYANRPSRADLIMTDGEVLFAKMKDTIKVLIGSPETKDKIFSTGFYILKPKENILQKFLYFYFLSDLFNKQKNYYCTGATMSALTNEGLKKITIGIPVDKNGNPDLAEQERIVAILEEAEKLKQKRAEADQKMDWLIPALFSRMFGDVVANDKQWSVVKFSEIGKARLGKMLDAKQQTGENKRLYLRNANVQWNKIELHDLLEMDFSEKERGEFRLHYGDLLICEGGEIGRAAIWKDKLTECYFQKALHRVRLNLSLATPEFVLYFLKSLAIGGFNSYTSGTATIAHLTGVQLASIRVPLPPIALQNQFAEAVKEIEVQKEKQKQSAVQISSLFSSLLAKSYG